MSDGHNRQAVIAAALDELAERVRQICEKRGWDLGWSSRGCYLHLEASELIESLRGKGRGTPAEEAADVLFVLLSILGGHDIAATDVLRHLHTKMDGAAAKVIGRDHGA